MPYKLKCYAVLIKKKTSISADIPREIRDEDGVFYGFQINDQDRWKIGEPNTYAMAYFDSKDDAEALQAILNQDSDVQSGAIEIQIQECFDDVIRQYPSSNRIMLNRVYPELCINGYSESLPPMTLTEALEFYQQ